MNDIKKKFVSMMKAQKKFKLVEKNYNKLKSDMETRRLELMNLMNDMGTNTMKGTLGTASILESVVPAIDDWRKFYKYIHSHKAFDLLQQRPAVTAYRDRIIDGAKIPGTSPLMRKTMRITLTKT